MIIGYIGKPRSGKTTALALYVQKNERAKKFNKFLHFKLFREYSHIYSNEYFTGVTHIEAYDVGSFPVEDHSLFLIDEAGIYFNNRCFKSIPEHCTTFFALHGHYKSDIVWASQTADVDKKLRNRTNFLYLVHKSFLFPNVSWCKFITYDVTVSNDTKDLVEGYSMDVGLMKVIGYLTGRNKLLYRKRLYKYFDSFSKPIQFKKADPDHKSSELKKIELKK